MIKALIFEDEPLAADRLIGLLTHSHSEIEVLTVLDTVNEGVSYLESNSTPDLIFMDVELADGKCFEIFEFFDLKSPIIFTTAYDEYPIQAFNYNCIDYLLKPIKSKDLSRAIGKYVEFSAPRNVRKKKGYKSHFLGKLGAKLFYKKAEEISLFYSEDKITYIIDQHHKKFIVNYTLEELESQFLNPDSFYRISRKHIVNLNAVAIVKSYINQRLSLELNVNIDHPVIVSREKVSDFKTWLDR